jgi:uroporphyrinogen-III decarboxylase
MENALADTLLEPEMVRELMRREEAILLTAVRKAAELGFDAVCFADDLGTQKGLFISPATFRDLFKPVYAAVADETRRLGMSFMMHSCGMVYEVIPDLIEAGINSFQFDQPELYGSDVLAREFGSKAVFCCPVDIQKIMPTGDRKTIEEGALRMVNNFKQYGQGSLIVNDYGSWKDLYVKEEWAAWARDVVAANAAL